MKNRTYYDVLGVPENADIATIPNPHVGLKITVKLDETNNNKMTDYIVKSLKADSIGIANSLIDEIVPYADYLGVSGASGEGLTTEQAQQLQTAYEHSQSVHVQASDIPSKTSELTNDSDFATKTPAPTTSKEGSTSGTQAAISSTGEQESNSASKAKSFEDVINQVPAGDEINNEALSKFIVAAKANHDIDLDAMANKLISEYVAKGSDRAIVENAVTKAKNIIQRKLDRLKANNNGTTMRSSIDEVLIAQSTITEVISDTDAVKAYKEAVKHMIAQYAKEVGLEELDGKLYINLEDLLRYNNTSTN